MLIGEEMHVKCVVDEDRELLSSGCENAGFHLFSYNTGKV